MTQQNDIDLIESVLADVEEEHPYGSDARAALDRIVDLLDAAQDQREAVSPHSERTA